jgi:hypothetical protein
MRQKKMWLTFLILYIWEETQILIKFTKYEFQRHLVQFALMKELTPTCTELRYDVLVLLSWRVSSGLLYFCVKQETFDHFER